MDFKMLEDRWSAWMEENAVWQRLMESNDTDQLWAGETLKQLTLRNMTLVQLLVEEVFARDGAATQRHIELVKKSEEAVAALMCVGAEVDAEIEEAFKPTKKVLPPYLRVIK